MRQPAFAFSCLLYRRPLPAPGLVFCLLLAFCLLLVACGDDNGAPPADASVDGAAADGETADAGPAGPPGCQPPAAPEPTLTTCPGDSLPAPASGTCTVTAGGAALLITGDVLTPGRVFRGGQVLVDATGSITCVGCDCSGEPASMGATQIVCPDGVVSPGLINTHEHLSFQGSPYTMTPERYEHRHHWRKGTGGHARITTGGGFATREEMAWGELRHVFGGATSVNGSANPAGLLRNLDRSAMEGLGQPRVDYDTFPLDDNSGTLLVGSCAYGGRRTTAADIASDDAYTPHVAEGIGPEARNEFLCMRDGADDLVQPQSAFIHGVGLLPPDIGEMAADGTSLIWSPRSNVTLYGDTARVTEYANLGVPIALGTDWLRSGSMNMLRELRCADEIDTTYLGDFFTDEQLWLMATRSAAEVLAVDDVLGTLEPGKVADIAIFDASVHGDHRAVIDADPQDVVLVLRGGMPLYGDADVVAALPTGDACEAVDVCGVARRACVSREVGMSFAALRSANADSYPLFFCDTPMNEPSCLPARDAEPPFPDPEVAGSNRYDGMISDGDRDGDGIADDVDDCTCTFNPIRPLDEGTQADFDGDGVGDACDPCPLTEGLSGCRPPDSGDRDGDGTPNATDNCPDDPNPLQEDRDGDGKGDVCDACPDQANPGSAACLVTIYDVKDGTVAPGSEVTLSAPVVTAVGPNGFFMQVDPAGAAYTGVDHSAVFVYTASAPMVTRGDRVDVGRATVTDYFGEIELTSATFTVTASGVALPPVEDVTSAEVDTAGARAGGLEGALVRVTAVTVTDIMPPPGPRDMTPTGEFAVDTGLRVDDMLFRIDPFPSLDEVLSSVTGVLAFRNGSSKLEPRDAADVVFGATALAGLEPALSFARVGAGTAPTFPAPLTVRLTRPATTDTTVTLTSSDPGLAVADVVVPMGATTAIIPVDGLAASPLPYTVTAMFGGRMAGADVRVLSVGEAPRLVDLRPASATVIVDGIARLEVALDIPAPAGGTAIMLSVDMGGTAPASVTIPAGQLMAGFDFHAGMTAATSTLTAVLDAVLLTARVDVVDRAPGGLLINEVDYDQPGADSAEFLELYNASASTLDLTPYVVVFINGASTMEYRRVDLMGSLAPGGYLVIANAGVSVPMGVSTVSLPANGIQNGAPDGLAILDLTRGIVVDALSYEGSITMVSVAGFPMSFSLVETAPLPAAVLDSGAGSLIRFPNGVDTDDSSADWAFTTTPTPGAPNLP